MTNLRKSALNLRLDDDGRRKLLDYCIDRLRTLRKERERSDWWQKRLHYERVAEGDYSWRKGGVFDKCNENMPVVRSVARFIRARLRKDLFGSSPWFHARPLGRMDRGLADRVQKHLGWKLAQSNYVEKVRLGLRVAVELGEFFIKTSWTVDEDVREEIKLVAVDPETLEPLVDDNGREIDIDRNFDVLGIDPGAVEWQERPVKVVERTYSGLVNDVVNFRDVLFPLNCTNFEQADFVAHRYTMRLLDLMARFDPDGDDEEMADIARLLRAESTLSKEADGGDGSILEDNRADRRVDFVDDNNPDIGVTECYFDYDPIGDGRKRKIFAVICESQGILLDVRYLGEVSPGARIPVDCIAINRKPSCVWGEGVYEIYDRLGMQIDRLLNAVIYHNNYNSDPAKIVNFDLVKSGRKDKTMVIAPGEVLEADRAGVNPKDVMSIIAIPDLDQRTWSLLQSFMQMVQVESGVSSAAQGDLSALPQNTTATGINSMLETSSVLHLDILDELRSQIGRQLSYAARVLYFWQDADETFEFMEGDSSEGTMRLLDARQVGAMDMDVQLLVTRTRRQEMREAAVAAIPIHEKFFALPPNVQRYALDLYRQALKGFEFENADDLFPSDEDIINVQETQEAQQTDAAATQAGVHMQATS